MQSCSPIFSSYIIFFWLVFIHLVFIECIYICFYKRNCEWVEIEYGIVHDNCRPVYPDINTSNVLFVAFVTMIMTIAMCSIFYDSIFHYLLLPASNEYGKSKGAFKG